ncbi:hypothetical protein [Sphingobium sp.]|uniref:hypothetical protein n=1 Tax=Sphingobium sp. TaxID=1912891 RepID=UPI002E211CFD
MSPLTPEELAEFRAHVATFDMTDDRKNDLIRIVDNIAMSFIDQAFGSHPVQLSLSARANARFLGIPGHARLGTIREHEAIDLLEDASADTSPEGKTRHETE